MNIFHPKDWQNCQPFNCACYDVGVRVDVMVRVLVGGGVAVASDAREEVAVKKTMKTNDRTKICILKKRSRVKYLFI